MELFRDLFAKLIRKHLYRSPFLIKLQAYILQLHWKKILQHRCFVLNFARYLRQNSSRQLLLFYGKYFTYKIVKNSLRKAKKWKQFVRKTMTHAEQKLNHNLYQIFISFCYWKIYVSLFSVLPQDILKTELLETMQSHWRFIYYRKLFLTFDLKK